MGQDMVKRTYEITDEADVAVKIKAVYEHLNPSDIVQRAIAAYCDLKGEEKEKDKKKKSKSGGDEIKR
jgi:hypothetical protein